jgi:hypothetical protein
VSRGKGWTGLVCRGRASVSVSVCVLVPYESMAGPHIRYGASLGVRRGGYEGVYRVKVGASPHMISVIRLHREHLPQMDLVYLVFY